MTYFALVKVALVTGSTLLAPSRSAPPTSGRVTSPEALTAFVGRATGRVPSYSRQTKMSCAMCHNGFPQLTPFGRLFKLNGYTLTGLTTITEQPDPDARKTLELSPIAPLSVMAIVSNTRTAKAIDGAQGSTTQFPQELSLFAATQISPRAGIFSQFTYEDQEGTFAIDNVDIRVANHASFRGKDLLYGATLHNNPTIQDVWNSTPAWGYPFTSSGVTPAPMTAPLIEDGLGQAVLGLGGYALYDGLVYAELTGYTSAQQGAALPLDGSAADAMRGVSPYWRVALQRNFGATYAMVGTFGLVSQLRPDGITGATNHYSDVGVDAQVERKVGEKGMLIGRANYIKESQEFTASFTELPAAVSNLNNTLNSYKLNVTYLRNEFDAFTVGLFGLTGTQDGTLYEPGDVTGSASGKPNSQGATFEWTHSPWLNTRLSAQYVMYTKFNGGSTSYDLATGGRNARSNNSLYIYLWLAY